MPHDVADIDDVTGLVVAVVGGVGVLDQNSAEADDGNSKKVLGCGFNERNAAVCTIHLKPHAQSS